MLSMADNETDFKKMYSQHVQENIDLRKHIQGLEKSKAKKVHELSNSQNAFLRKYKKYTDGSLKKPSKSFSLTSDIKDNRDLSRLVENGTPVSSRMLPPINNKGGDTGHVTKNTGVTSPVDFPYSFDSWQVLVNNGCKDASGVNVLDVMRDNLVREETPYLSRESSLLTTCSRPSSTKNDDSGDSHRISNTTETRMLRREKTEMTFKHRSERRHSLSISDKVAIAQNLENTLPSKNDKNYGNLNKQKSSSMRRLSDVDTEDGESFKDAKQKLKNIKLPKINVTSAEPALTANRNQDIRKSYICGDGSSTPIETSIRQRGGRRHSLAPNLLKNYQQLNILRQNTQCDGFATISEDVSENDADMEGPKVPRGRSLSHSQIDKFNGKNESFEKATLKIMMENSKGLKKFKYLTRIVNAELRDITENNEVRSTQDNNSNNNVLTCRYLRLPKHLQSSEIDLDDKLE